MFQMDPSLRERSGLNIGERNQEAIEQILAELTIPVMARDVGGTSGRRLTLDLETRRVGTSIAPVLTVFSASGTAMAQGRESKSTDHDCRLTVVMPPEGSIVVQVRDNLYGGSDQANYRLRADPAPYATGLFPLGGPRGQRPGRSRRHG